MLRTIFVGLIIVTGTIFSLRGPFYALLFYLWYAYFRPEQWMWNNWVSSLNLSYFIGLFVVASTVISAKPLHLRSRTWLIALFAVHASISTYMSPYFQYGWPYLQDFYKVLLITYLITVLVDDARKLRITVLIMSLSLGLEAAKQGWAQFILNPGAQNNNPLPLLGDNNGVGLGMLMLLPLLIALAQTATKRGERPFFRFLAVGAFLRGITTYSRGAFLAAATLAIFYILRSKQRIAAVFAIGVLAGVVLPVMPQQFWDRMWTVNASEEERDESARARLHYWQVGLNMAESAPLLGVGFNSFKAAYDDYDFSNGYYGDERTAHSTWFGVMGELGYVGLVLFVAILISSLLSCWRLERITSDHPDVALLKPFAFALQGSFFALIVGGTFLHTQSQEMLWHLFGLSMAMQRIATTVLEGEHARIKQAATGEHVRVPPRPQPAYASQPARRL
jgi:probable O-glycosylation ligase (exosortase A-associated)